MERITFSTSKETALGRLHLCCLSQDARICTDMEECDRKSENWRLKSRLWSSSRMGALHLCRGVRIGTRMYPGPDKMLPSNVVRTCFTQTLTRLTRLMVSLLDCIPCTNLPGSSIPKNVKDQMSQRNQPWEFLPYFCDASLPPLGGSPAAICLVVASNGSSYPPQ